MVALVWGNANVDSTGRLVVPFDVEVDRVLLQALEEHFFAVDNETRGQSWGRCRATEAGIVVHGVTDDTDAGALREYVESPLGPAEDRAAREREASRAAAQAKIDEARNQRETAERLTDRFREV